MAGNELRTRIAPSPTGKLHVGTARAALFNELFARHSGGKFILRIEDTDKERSKAEFERDILEGLRWLGLEWDEGPDKGGPLGPYRQSERGGQYQEALQYLIEKGQAYQEKGAEVIKFKVTEEMVTFIDLVRGKVTIPSTSWGGDFIIARSPKDPLYHLAVVVDDYAMKISHVIRGEDHLTNTARHILLQKALGYPAPQYAHLPLLLDTKRRKLSKRAGDVSLLSYRDKGYLSTAMLNYLALLGWRPASDRELFSHNDLIKQFALQRVQKGGAVFDETKLESMNKHYLGELSAEELLIWGKFYLQQNKERQQRFAQLSDDRLLAALQTEQGRVSSYDKLDVLIDWARPDWEATYPPDLLVWRKSTVEATTMYLKELFTLLSSKPREFFAEDSLSQNLLIWVKEKKWHNGDVLWPMRVALTGQENSPGPFEVAAVLGKEETVKRIQEAYRRLAKGATRK